MKKIIIKTGFLIGLFSMLLLGACKEKIDPVVDELFFSRAFSPVGLSADISDVTTVTLSWSAVKNADYYVLEIYEGTDFTVGAMIFTVDIPSSGENVLSYEYVLPAGDTQFSARMKTVSTIEGVDASKWAAVEFKSDPENLFKDYIPVLTGLNACTVEWEPGSVATALLFDNGTNETSYPLSAGEITAGAKDLTGVPNGVYEIRLMNGTFVRGRTNLVIEGDVLLEAGGDLASAITSTPAGGVIILSNGASFSFTGPITLTKSVKIRGLYDTDLPVLFTVLDAATYHMFNIDASLTAADSLVFENVDINGFPDGNSANTKLRGMFDQDVALPCNIGILKYHNSIMRNFDRHLVRLRGTASQIINKIIINNCILYNYAFGSNYGVINSSAATGTINRIEITNSTIAYTRGAIISYTNGTACQGITIANCTFNQLAFDAASARYLIDLNATTGTGVLAITNCVFGSTSALANGIRPNTMTMTITGSYYTSDFNDGTTFPIKSYLTAYANASTALWIDPVATYNFHFLDSGFAGIGTAGDPRWRP